MQRLDISFVTLIERAPTDNRIELANITERFDVLDQETLLRREISWFKRFVPPGWRGCQDQLPSGGLG